MPLWWSTLYAPSKLPACPKRSIRFILFSGEEEGIDWIARYAIAHRAELDKAAGVVIFDSGIGRVTGFSLGGRRTSWMPPRLWSRH